MLQLFTKWLRQGSTIPTAAPARGTWRRARERAEDAERSARAKKTALRFPLSLSLSP
ncbi:unnamed protein product [Spirodela intermedia]|uniref:Uncharacterized protein n=1 Tax=Spirodela intermedia TaxID=51605 RepID=A0A7I8LL85_SPIIN|nr:unnamed protein product [Spirodela intermedia]